MDVKKGAAGDLPRHSLEEAFGLFEDLAKDVTVAGGPGRAFGPDDPVALPLGDEGGLAAELPLLAGLAFGRALHRRFVDRINFARVGLGLAENPLGRLRQYPHAGARTFMGLCGVRDR